jgi:sigma-B regulation protein RsbU (phosphoserine phosphatase)
LLDSDVMNVHTGTIALGIRYVLCLPLQLTRVVHSSGETVHKRIGVLYLDSRRDGALLSDTTRAGLETLAKEAADAIESARLYSEELEKHRLEQELNIAAQIQQALLPKGDYAGRGVETAAVSVPCRAIGGDFFEYVELPDGGFGFALGDVAGKGAPAALLTAIVQGGFATRATDGERPARIMTRLNQAIIHRAVRARFVTMIYGIVSPDGQLTYCNAGHNPPLLIGRAGVRRLEGGGIVLGVLEQAAYEDVSVALSPGDVIVVFSDGVSESVNPNGEQYEDHRIADCVRAHLESSPKVMLERLAEDVGAFSAGAAQPDDWTALILRYHGSAAEGA